MPTNTINPAQLAQVPMLLSQAYAHHQQGNLAQAQTLYESVLKIDSYNFDALRLFGHLAYQINQHQKAVELVTRAIALNPKLESLYLIRGLSLQALSKFDDALSNYDSAIAFNPNYFEAYYNRGNVLRDLKRADLALRSYDQAITLRPDVAEVYTNRGLALCDLGQHEEALLSYDTAILLKPNLDIAHNSRGNILSDLKRQSEALLSYDRAISLNPNYAEAYSNRGNALFLLKRLDEALINYDKAIALKPDYVEAYYNRGLALKEAMRIASARQDFEKVLQLNPHHYRARWILGFLDIPAIFHDENEIETSREAFQQALQRLDDWFDESKLNGAEEAVAAILPFHLAYQDKNNKDLLSQYGRLACRLMQYWQNKNQIRPRKLTPEGRIKIGVISSHVRDHSVWEAIAKGWLLNFDSSKFEWHVFSLFSVPNETTELIRRKANSFVEKPCSFSEWASRIIQSEIEVLIYPEIGMDVLTAKLATLRLAPLQIASWGHPETTGLGTIDYYLSAELLEPKEANSNYTESLIKLPNLGCTYTPHRVIPEVLDLSEFGISSNTPILLCPGTAYKYSPKYDGVFPQIAQRLGVCSFVFFDQSPPLTAILKARLKAAFENAHLVMDNYVVFIPWLSREKFYALMQRADVFMDTIGFSGFNTAMQAVECSLPIVTVDGNFMRGRLASGILKRLQLDELICDSESAYCDTVVRLVSDASFKAQVISKIENRRNILYGDLEPLRSMEKFLWNKCRGNCGD